MPSPAARAYAQQSRRAAPLASRPVPLAPRGRSTPTSGETAGDSHTDRKVYVSRCPDARTGSGVSSAKLLLAANAYARSEEGEGGATAPRDFQIDFSDDLVAISAALFHDGASSDVTLRTPSGKKYQLHRAVLAGWSRVFRDAFTGLDTIDAVDAPFEAEPPALENMLRSLYTGWVELQHDTAVPLLAIFAAYGISAPAAACKQFLDANFEREHWGNELRHQLRAMRGVGSMDEMWRRAEELVHRVADTPVARSAQLSMRTESLRVNTSAELLHILASLFNARSPGQFSDATLVLQRDEFLVHRGIISGWSTVLRKKFAQQRDHDPAAMHGYATRVNGGCRVKLAFEFGRTDGIEPEQADTATAATIGQMLRVFYTGQLLLSNELHAHRMLQAAVAFEVPSLELACRTWLMARLGSQPLTLPKPKERPPPTGEINGQLANTSHEGHGTRKVGLPSKQPADMPNVNLPSAIDPLDGIYNRLNHSGYGLSLQEVDQAMDALAPTLVGHNSGTEDLKVTLVGRGAHGIILDPLKGPPFTVAEIMPDSLASRVRPPIRAGMQLLAVNKTSLKASPNPQVVHELLDSASAGKAPVTLTMRSDKIREEDRAKVLHWAFNAADLGGDGWITRRQFSRMGQYLQYVHAKYQQIQQVIDKLGKLLNYEDFSSACKMMKERGTLQDFENLRLLTAQSSKDSSPSSKSVQAAETIVTFQDTPLGVTFVEDSAWAAGNSSHSTRIANISSKLDTATRKGQRQIAVGDFIISVDGVAVAYEQYSDVLRRIEDCRLPVNIGFGSRAAIASQMIGTHEFLNWIIRRSSMGSDNKLQTTHIFDFNKPGTMPLALRCVRDEDRGVDTAVVKWVTQDSEVEMLPGLRSGMILTSVYSPALCRTKHVAERFKSWAFGHKHAPSKMSQGARKRIKVRKKIELDCLEGALKKSMAAATGGRDGMQRNEGGFLGWEALCLIGVDAVSNLLKLLFSSSEAVPITLGFSVGAHKVWFPGDARCDAALRKVSRDECGFISLSQVDDAVRYLFGSFDVEIAHKSIVRAYNAAEDRGDGYIQESSFRRLVQYAVYFHNNSSLLDGAESVVHTHDQSLSLNDFIQCCDAMGECLTDEQAISEFTERQSHPNGSFSFDNFCTWIVQRAAFRMQMERAEPRTVHADSHTSAQPRAGRLVMPPKAKLKTIFQQHASFGRMPATTVSEAVSEVFWGAPTKRQGQLVPCALQALKADLTERGTSPGGSIEFSDFMKLLRYNITLDDLWDKISQCVHHQMQPRADATTGCCSAPQSRLSGKIDHIMLRADFAAACQLSAVELPEHVLHIEYDNLERMGSDGHVHLRDFCAWIIRRRHSPGQAHRSKLNRLSRLKTVLFAMQHDQVDHTATMQMATELVGDDVRHHATIMDAALEAAQGRRRSSLRNHEVLAFLEHVVFLDGVCGPIFTTFGASDRNLHLGDFRRCCDLVGLHIAEAEIAHEFRHMGSLTGQLTGDGGVLADGHVTLKDFLVWVARREGPSWASWMQNPPQSRIDSVFQRFSDEGGFLSPVEVRQGVKELFPGFENDELMTLALHAIQNPYADTSSDGLLDKEHFALLLRLILCLAKFWDESAHSASITESTFHKVCLAVGLDVNPAESARHFVQLDTFNDGNLPFRDFCTWALRRSLHFPQEKTNPKLFFDRHERNGTISLARVSEAVEKYADCDTSVHYFIVLAHKAAGIRGISQVSREQFSNLFLYVKEFKSMEPMMRRLYDTYGEGPATDSSALDLGRRLSVERLLEDRSSGVNENNGVHEDDAFASLQFKTNGRNYIKFGDYCCWLVQRRVNQFHSQRQRMGAPGTSIDSLLDTLSPKALYRLGLQYQRGDRVPKSTRSAAHCFRGAAKCGLVEAKRSYGECLAAGDGVTQDLQQAAYFYQQAATQGDCIATSHLGVCYLKGLGVNKDLEAAVNCFRGASDDPVAQFNLGVCLFNGHGVDQDWAEAVKQYQKAAKHGLPEAQCNLGECLMNGSGVGKEPAKAVELYMQAARQGLAAAMFNLGMCFSHGHGVEPDEAESIRYYTLAANQGHRRAASKLAKVEEQTYNEHSDAQYQHGMVLYEQWCSSDHLPALKDAIRCFVQASNLQHRGAYCILAKLLAKGEGMDIDEEEAYTYAKLAADAHDIEAADLLGGMLLARWAQGSDPNQILDEAIYYFTLAAEGGVPHAQFSLGQIYLAQGYDASNGKLLKFVSTISRAAPPFTGTVDDSSRWHVPTKRHLPTEAGFHAVNLDGLFDLMGDHVVSDEEALATGAHWLAKSAQGGNTEAMLSLGALYLRGDGVHQSDVEATGWYRLAADYGNASGQCAAGWLILKGTGTPRVFTEAKYMFQCSAQQQHMEAIAALSKMDHLETCARQSNGDFSVFLGLLNSVDVELCAHAEKYASTQVVAQPLKETLQVHSKALQQKIRNHALKHTALSEESAQISQKRGTLDAYRRSIAESHVPHTRLVIVSSRHAALALLLKSAQLSVAIVMCDETDTFDSIVARVARQAPEKTLRSIALMVPAHNDCLPLVPSYPISSATVSSANVTSFWKDLCDCVQDRIDILRCSPGKDVESLDSGLAAQLQNIESSVAVEVTTLTSDTYDAVGEYFVKTKVQEWYAVASEHQVVRSKQVKHARDVAKKAEMEAHQTEEEYIAEQRVRSEELNARRQRRQEQLRAIGAPAAVQLQLQSEQAVAPIEITMDTAQDTLFQRGLLDSTRRMSRNAAEGLSSLPWVIELCARRVEMALEGEGGTGFDAVEIFKAPQNLAAFDDLQNKLNHGGDNLELGDFVKVDMLDAAFIIVKWLTELPKPLLSSTNEHSERSIFERFQEVGAHCDDPNSATGEAIAVEQLRELVKELPAEHTAILKFVLKLVRKVVTAADGLDVHRISLAITPTILRDAKKFSQPGKADIPRLNYRVVALMVKHFDWVFGKPIVGPGYFQFNGELASVVGWTATGCLCLNPDQRVEGFVTLDLPTSSSLDAATVPSLQHIISGGWQWDGSVNFRARGPRQHELRITVKEVTGFAATHNLKIFVDVSSPEMRRRTSSQVISGGTAQWPESCGQVVLCTDDLPPELTVRCMNESKDGINLLGEETVGVAESGAMPWARELAVPLTIKQGTEMTAATILMLAEWNPPHVYQYELRMSTEEHPEEQIAVGSWSTLLASKADQEGTVKLKLSRLHGTCKYARVHANVQFGTGREGFGMAFVDRRHGSKRVCHLSKFYGGDSGSQRVVETAGLLPGARILQINGQHIESASQATRILNTCLDKHEPDAYVDLLFEVDGLVQTTGPKTREARKRGFVTCCSVPRD